MSSTDDPVRAARDAIWRLFDDGLIDDDSATLALLAIDVGVRRTDAFKSWRAEIRDYIADRSRTGRP